MKREEYKINVPYSYDSTVSRVPYKINDKNCNIGEAVEIFAKSVLGYAASKDANTAFDCGSDIPELNASVKSGKATLVNSVLGSDFNSIKKAYFNRVHSTLWIFGVIINDNIVLYFMHKKEFELFLDTFGYYDKSRSVIRIKGISGKMLAWLDKKSHATSRADDGTGHGGYDGGYAARQS